MPIITLDGFKDYQGIKSSTQDDQLQVIVEYATSLVEGYCNTSFSPVAVSDKRVTVLPSDYEVIIPNVPIISLDEVKTFADGAVVDTIDLAQCYLDPELGILTLPHEVSLPNRRNNLVLSYTYGYSTPPPAVVLACYELVTHIHKREFLKSKAVDGQNANFQDPKVLPTHIRTALDLFKVL